MRKTWTAALVCTATLLLSSSLSACGGSAPSGTTGGNPQQSSGNIKIGSLHPLSGSNAADGHQLDNGAKLAVEAINAAGGIKSLGGAKLEITSGDTQGKPEIGQSEAQRLIQQGAVALVGTYQSAVSANVAATAERSRLPFLMDVTGDDSVLQQGYKYSFRVQPSNKVLGTKGAQHLKAMADAAGRPVTKVAYLHEQTAFGRSEFAAFQAEAQRLGIQVGPEISYDASNVSDLTTQVTRAKAEGANVLAVSGYYRDSVLAAQAIGSVKPQIDAVYGVGDGAFDLSDFSRDVGADGEGYFDVNYHLDAKNPEAQKLAKLYQDRFHDEMRTEAALAYDAVRVVADSLERAHSRDPQKLRDAIAGTSLDPMVVSAGPIQFDPTGENRNAIPAVTQVRQGQIKQVYPPELAEMPPTYPAFPNR